MSDLLVALRENDLPPKWDGFVVAWQGWRYVRAAFICPPRVEVCEGCGMPTMERGFPAWSVNQGLVADSRRLTLDDFAYEEANRARLPEWARHKAPRHWRISLQAFRCHSCSLDTVWDMNTQETWVLDYTDYGNDGSAAPTNLANPTTQEDR